MSDSPTFNVVEAHRHFASRCFNEAWVLIEKPRRTAAEDEEMVRLNQASLWHWTQRDDCTDRNLAIGYWQASRIRALIGHADEARRYAALSLQHSGSLSPFYRGYAYEALARAEAVGGDVDASRISAATARALASGIDDEAERKLLLDDLTSIGP